jgi:hypothetical protein
VKRKTDFFNGGRTVRNDDPDDSELPARVRALLAAGKLPCVDASGLWGGTGNSEPCCVCWRPIGSDEIAFDLLFRTSTGDIDLHMHPRCHAIWESERRSWLLRTQSRTPSTRPPRCSAE